ncbi:MAG: aldo/keto reductase [Candidatus Aminicenantales bacterium]
MISRRSFISMTGFGAAGLALGESAEGKDRAGGPGRQPSQTATEEPPAPPRIQARRALGKTGLELSDVGCGAINLFNPNVLRYAFECGVNHFDTAEGYMNGNSEKALGQALKDIRPKVVITSKYLLRTPADYDRAALIRRVEASLKRLQTDYLDIAMVHDADQPEKLAHEEVVAAYSELKRQGKARLIGFSTHAPGLVLEQAAASGVWEVLLTIYNHMEGPAVESLLAAARRRGIGIIAMKVLAGGMQGSLKPFVNDKVSYAQAAMRWVLGSPWIDALIVTMSTFSHVEEYVAASGAAPRRTDAAILERYRGEAGTQYCRVGCRECLAACPRGVAVNEVLRYAMYFEHYGMEKHACALYRRLGTTRKPTVCAGCEAPCEKACPHGLRVRDRLLRSHRLLRI